MRGYTLRFAVLGLFLFSGASGLIYQIAWTKQLTHIMGVTVYAVTCVLSSFMAGLALGSFLFGRHADNTRNPLRLYAILEGLIGLYALLMPGIFYLITRFYVWAHNAAEADTTTLIALRFILCFVVLLIPTTLMGGTLPVLTRFFVNREHQIGLGVGSLYSINTAGAVLGCFMAGFILIPIFGVSQTTWIAVAVNLGVAVLALLISRIAIPEVIARTPAEPASTPAKPASFGKAEAKPHTDDARSRRAAITVFWVIGVSGFAALGFEVLWTRILIYTLGPSTYAFSAMLTTFLVGIALGSWLISRYTDRLKDPVSFLGIIELGLGLSTLVAVLLIDHMIPMQKALTGYFQSSSWISVMGTRFILAFVYMFLPTFFMGAAFPVAAKIYSRGLSTIGKSVGNIYSINTVFGILGSLCTGFLLIPFLGLQRSIVVLVCINMSLGLILFLVSPFRAWLGRSALVATSIILLVAASLKFEDHPIILRSTDLLFRENSQNFDILYCKEGVDASLAVIEGQRDGVRELNINGTSTAYSSVADLKVHRLLAHIPLATHPDPKRVMVIGFGLGVTSYGTLLHDIEAVDCVELVADEAETAAYFDKYNHNVMNHPRFNFIAEDGRNYALTTQHTYEVISMNAIHPSLAPSLYTYEFYDTCREKMTPDGLMCVWLPITLLAPDEMRMLLKTFQAVFPGTTVWYNNPAHFILLGSLKRDFTINYELLCQRLAIPEVHDDLVLSGMSDPHTFLSLLMMLPDEVEKYTGNIPLNTDDRPYIEFSRSIECGFAHEVLMALYFTNKADVTEVLTHFGETETDRMHVKQQLDLYNEAWPFMVEGELLMWTLPQKKEKECAIRLYNRAMTFTPSDLKLSMHAREVYDDRSYNQWQIKKLKESLSTRLTDRAKTRLKLAKLMNKSAWYAEAVETLEACDDSLVRNSLDYKETLTEALVGAGDIKRALRLTGEMVSQFPESISSKALRAWLLLAQPEDTAREEALLLARNIAKAKPTVDHLGLLGIAQRLNKEYVQAEKTLQQVLKKAYDIHYVYRYQLAQVRAELKLQGGTAGSN